MTLRECEEQLDWVENQCRRRGATLGWLLARAVRILGAAMSLINGKQPPAAKPLEYLPGWGCQKVRVLTCRKVWVDHQWWPTLVEVPALRLTRGRKELFVSLEPSSPCERLYRAPVN